jgi:low temperature requirement protein LtrA
MRWEYSHLLLISCVILLCDGASNDVTNVEEEEFAQEIIAQFGQKFECNNRIILIPFE